ncbi:DUF3168 domain-containing protein [Nitrobacter sp.]|uniref:DUF3168 domain-containing protein n=1 Tax=Nitrobacter sp. TaxID=29420 RepID=UPI001E1848FF|nr:DUF3168 domain-containing protein [Nitrobacter sp.]MCB1394387.1 DUF3168 domain-containing protein [Nitrobacter sp.]
MTSPSLELQGAIVARLKTFADLAGLVADRIYDRVPTAPAFPYVSLGPAQSVSDDADCITGFEITLQIDAWSRAVGFPEVKRVAEAVRAALHQHELPLADNALVSLEHRQTRDFRDPDGLTNHAAIEFVALVEQP